MPPPQNDKNEQDWKEKLLKWWSDEKGMESDFLELSKIIGSAISQEVLKDRVQTREKADRLARSEERGRTYEAIRKAFQGTRSYVKDHNKGKFYDGYDDAMNDVDIILGRLVEQYPSKPPSI